MDHHKINDEASGSPLPQNHSKGLVWTLARCCHKLMFLEFLNRKTTAVYSTLTSSTSKFLSCQLVLTDLEVGDIRLRSYQSCQLFLQPESSVTIVSKNGKFIASHLSGDRTFFLMRMACLMKFKGTIFIVI